MRNIVVLVVLLAGGCEKASAPPTEGAGSAVVAGPNEDCGPAEQQRRWDLIIEASERYMKGLEAIRDGWTSCETAAKALTLNAPEASRYEGQMKDLMVWIRARGKTCAEAMEARFTTDSRLADLGTRGERLDADIKPRAETCKDHPGFREAFDAGVRLMKK
jgi:hypothetical protein